MAYVIAARDLVSWRTRPGQLAPTLAMSAGTTRKEDGHERVSEHAHGGPGSRRLCRRLVLGPVIKDLQAHDLPVLAPPNPLRGLAHDAEYIAS